MEGTFPHEWEQELILYAIASDAGAAADAADNATGAALLEPCGDTEIRKV